MNYKPFKLSDSDRTTAKSYGVFYLVDTFMNVGESDRDVAKDIINRAKRAGTIPKPLRKVLAKAAVERQRENRGLYNDVVAGRIGR
jgi:hypothetical protein